ncbi:MAG: flavin reductase family protein [Bdellovibrionales bacterium]|nr:flavin reductase family protein [Bdellovibrionales bacterium]
MKISLTEKNSQKVKTMVELDPAKCSQKDLYKLLIGAIVPRPIAFVSTYGVDGSTNLAPFSFFNGVSTNPPCLMFSCASTPTKAKKDTLVNIEGTGEFVVNSANEWLIQKLVHTGAEFPYGVSEMEQVGLSPLPGTKVQAQRVAESAVQFECKVHTLVPIGDGSPGSATVIVGEIVFIHIQENCIKDGNILFEEYKAIARLGGLAYGKIEETFDMPIPRVE